MCPELEQLVTEHPVRERLRGQLMIALYRCGRQADALQTYQEGRSLLVEELAVEPGPELRKLQQAVLEQDPALDLPAAPPGRPEGRRAGRAGRCGGRWARRTSPPRLILGRGRRRIPVPHRRIRRITLALGTAAALAALTSCRCPATRAAHTALNGNLVALVSASDGAVRATVPLQRRPPAWR